MLNHWYGSLVTTHDVWNRSRLAGKVATFRKSRCHVFTDCIIPHVIGNVLARQLTPVGSLHFHKPTPVQVRSQAKIPEGAKPFALKSTSQRSNDGEVLCLRYRECKAKRQRVQFSPQRVQLHPGHRRGYRPASVTPTMTVQGKLQLQYNNIGTGGQMGPKKLRIFILRDLK